MMLPATSPAVTRADLISLLIALVAHAGVIVAFLNPDRRLGAGGIDIVTVAPALDARTNARGRGAAAADRQVMERDGDQFSTPEEAATSDSRQELTQAMAEPAPAPADIVVPEWVEPPRQPDPQSSQPIIAPVKAASTERDATTQLRPSLTEQPMSVIDSIPAAATPSETPHDLDTAIASIVFLRL